MMHGIQQIYTLRKTYKNVWQVYFLILFFLCWKNHLKPYPIVLLKGNVETFYLISWNFHALFERCRSWFSMTEKEASDLYGRFIVLVFLTPFIGWINYFNRYLRKSIIIGGLMMG